MSQDEAVAGEDRRHRERIHVQEPRGLNAGKIRREKQDREGDGQEQTWTDKAHQPGKRVVKDGANHKTRKHQGVNCKRNTECAGAGQTGHGISNPDCQDHAAEEIAP